MLESEPPPSPLVQTLMHYELPRLSLYTDGVGELLGEESEYSDGSAALPELVRESDLEAVTEGAIGHPELCSRPCEFLHKPPTRCLSGYECPRCHLCDKRVVVQKVDKHSRQALAWMPYGLRTFSCLPHLRARAALWNFEAQAADFLAALQEETDHFLKDPQIGELTPCGTRFIPTDRKVPGQFWKSLKRMTFSEICRWFVLPASLPPSQVHTLDHIRRLYRDLRYNL